MKLVSVNIEEYIHVDSVLEYLKRTNPDIVCLQEVHQDTLAIFERELGLASEFAPMVSKAAFGKSPWGVAILSKFPIQKSESSLYDAFIEDYPEFRGTRPERPKAVLLTVELEGKDSAKPIVVACTHFTWSPNASITEEQKVNFKNLLPLLEKYPELILCGDFNSPRGKEIYDTLAKRYHDNIPQAVTSTIDPTLHRAGKLELVVDAIFSTPNYQIKSVKVVNQVSDHCAVEAEVNLVA